MALAPDATRFLRIFRPAILGLKPLKIRKTNRTQDLTNASTILIDQNFI